jgi:hypothetical protein
MTLAAKRKVSQERNAIGAVSGSLDRTGAAADEIVRRAAMLKRVIAGVAVAVMLAGSAAAGPFEDGAAAYKSGDYAEAVKMFRLAADQGQRDGTGRTLRHVR